MSFFPDFERLHESKRIRFIDVDGKIFLYNVRDSFILPIDNLPREFLGEVVKTTSPPVKTLILHVTYSCNFSCEHCYLKAGETRSYELNSNEQARIVREFGEMGGLGVDLSGGEALIKPGIEDVIYTAREQNLRTIILSNAGILDEAQLIRIAPYIDGIAVGLDGLYGANDEIRGNGTFLKIIDGLEKIVDQGIELSITTLITPRSIPQLLEFPEFMLRYGVKNWSLVMPRPSGRFADKQDRIDEAYILWEESRRGGLLKQLYKETKQRGISVVLDHILVPSSKRKIEDTSEDFVYEIYNKDRVCWDNTLTIMPNGDVKCCLFFDGQVYDNVKGRSLRDIYESEQRKRVLAEFRKYSVDKCPFLEKYKLQDFEQSLK